jgi:hypothetical protein
MKAAIILSLIVFSFSSGFAQQPPPPPMPVPIMPETQMMPPQMMMGSQQEKKSYPDSVEFAKYFKELYTLIGPKKSVKKDAEDYIARMSRSFAMQGIDSAKADSVSRIGLDSNAYRKIYFETYRRHLSAVELKKYLEFIKTPEGKHISEVMPQLNMAQAETSSYISRTISTNLSPLRRAAFEKMQKERPPSQGVPPPNMRPGQVPPSAPMQPPVGAHTMPMSSDSTMHR